MLNSDNSNFHTSEPLRSELVSVKILPPANPLMAYKLHKDGNDSTNAEKYINTLTPAKAPDDD